MHCSYFFHINKFNMGGGPPNPYNFFTLIKIHTASEPNILDKCFPRLLSREVGVCFIINPKDI